MEIMGHYFARAFALLILIFYFSNHAFSANGIANQSAISCSTTSATYSVPK